MIRDLDKTIRQILIAEMPYKSGEFRVAFDQPTSENYGDRLSKPTVNLFLYDVRENPILRKHQWERLPDGNGGENGGDSAHLKRSPMRVDCSYMLTTWANDPDTEHGLLSNCLLALFRFPTFSKEQLVGKLLDQPYEIQARLAGHDKLTNPAEVWSALDNEMRPSISYVVTLALDPWGKQDDVSSVPLVLTKEVRGKQAKEITGIVRDAEGWPLPGAQVRVEELKLTARTDADGRYVFSILPQGTEKEYVYHFVVAAPGHRPRRRKVTIPAENYDLEV